MFALVLQDMICDVLHIPKHVMTTMTSTNRKEAVTLLRACGAMIRDMLTRESRKSEIKVPVTGEQQHILFLFCW